MLAQRVADVLSQHGTTAALIGAGAMAVHGYPRGTSDLDLAVEADFNLTLLRVKRALESAGLRVVARAPDPDDPLGGVLDIHGPHGETVQVVNYHNDFSRGAGKLPNEAIKCAAVTDFDGKVSLRVVDLPHLVALKLYAGGPKSMTDVAELLDANPERLSDVKEVCAKFGFTERLQRVLQLMDE